jgi:hypothetical protein
MSAEKKKPESVADAMAHEKEEGLTTPGTADHRRLPDHVRRLLLRQLEGAG